MNIVINHSERPAPSTTLQAQRRAHCDHQFEVIAHQLGAALKRCAKGRSMEAQ
jgi:hypothetical protein